LLNAREHFKHQQKSFFKIQQTKPTVVFNQANIRQLKQGSSSQPAVGVLIAQLSLNSSIFSSNSAAKDFLESIPTIKEQT
jgi:hypothetical protein